MMQPAKQACPAALLVQDSLLDTLFAARLLCDICQQAPWTQRARTHHALLCVGCAAGEPTPAETPAETPP